MVLLGREEPEILQGQEGIRQVLQGEGGIPNPYKKGEVPRRFYNKIGKKSMSY